MENLLVLYYSYIEEKKNMLCQKNCPSFTNLHIIIFFKIKKKKNNRGDRKLKRQNNFVVNNFHKLEFRLCIFFFILLRFVD